MDTVETAKLPASCQRVFPFVDDLSAYPQWLRLVNSVESVASTDDGLAAWSVELRAKIGPFARSKRLRMVRTTCDAPHHVVFERRETDGKSHAMWSLAAKLGADGDSGSTLTMRLHYGGDLWAGGGVIGSVLNDEVKRGRRRLIELLDHDRDA